MKTSVLYPRQRSLVMPEVPNPFFHRLELSILDKIQIAIMSVTIAPIRLLLVGLMLVAVWPLAAIGVAFRSPEEANKPMTGWRWYYTTLLRFVARSTAFIIGFHYVKIKGRRASASEAPILVVAPHSGLFDGLVMAVGSWELPSWCCKSGMLDIPLLGHLIRFSQPVLVQREDPNSRTNTIKEIQRRSKSGGQWPQIFIFPEGTCSNRTCLITFKGGAFFPGVPVQPVCLRYHNRLDTITWTWDGPSAYQCLWYTLCQFQTHLEIEYLPVYTPSKEEIKDAKLYANNVRDVMARCLGLPVTDHTYDDCRLMQRALSLELPMSTGIVEFQKLHSKLGLDYDQMREMLNRFKKVAGNKGQITLTELASHLQVPQSPALEQVFRLYDRDGSGTIDFREYIIGLSLVSGPANTEDTLQLAFQLFDPQKKGYIDQEDLKTILYNAFSMAEEDAEQHFSAIDQDGDGKIRFEDMKAYVQERPEFAKLFTVYHELKAPATNGHGVAGSSNNSAVCMSDDPRPAFLELVLEPLGTWV